MSRTPPAAAAGRAAPSCEAKKDQAKHLLKALKEKVLLKGKFVHAVAKAAKKLKDDKKKAQEEAA